MRTSTRCNRGVPRGRTRWARGVTAMLTLFLLFAFLIPKGIFAQNVVIDGNAQTYANEWTRAGITHVADKFNLVNQDTIFGGSSKDYYYAGNTTTPFWTWVLGTAKDKDDIANGAAALVNAVDTGSIGNTVTVGAPFLVFAGDRISNSGDAQIGFWFFQDGTAPVTGGYFSPDKHAPPVRGDILVLADFTNGGRNAAVTVLEWVGTGGNYAGNAAFNQLATTEAAVAENNSGTSMVPTGWVFKDKNNNNNATNTTTYSTNEFYEGYVALGTLFGNVPVCFSRFMLETRSTHEITATLDDFVGGPLGGAPQPLVLTGSTVCAGSTGTITSSTSVSGLSYQLYNSSNTAVQAAQTGTTGSGLTWSNIPIANGYYVVTTNTSTQCTATSNTVNVAANPQPTAAFTAPTAQCLSGNSFTFTSTSSISSGSIASTVWNFGDGSTGTGSPASHTYATAGTYNVKLVVTSDQGCKDSVTHSITVNPQPVAAFTAPTAQCLSGNSFTFTSTSSISSGSIASTVWNFGDGSTGTGSPASHTYATAGTYNVKLVVTSDQGCKDSVTHSITVNPQPVAAFTAPTAQCLSGNSFTFTSTSSISGGSIASIAWNFGDGTTGTGSPASHTYAAAGSYTVKLVVTSDLGCKDSVTHSITVNPQPTAAFTAPPAQCLAGNNFTFTSTSSVSSGSIATTFWDFGDGSTGTGSPVSHSYASAGSYNVKLVVTSNLGCKDSVTHSITVNALPLVRTLVPTNFCANQPSTGSIKLLSSQVGVSYQLQTDGPTNVQAPKSGTGGDLTWTGLPAGNYSVLATVVATSCTSSSGPASVAENSVPDPTADPKDVCTGNTVALTGTPSGGTWSGAHVTGSTFDATGLAAGPYTVTYSVTNSDGCTASTTATVTVHALPTPTADNKEVCVGATVTLTGSPSGGTFSGAHVTGTTFDATGLTPGGYTVTYTVTDTYGCTGSTTATVTVKVCGGPLCTYTQGYYGNTNGNSCDADGTGSGPITYQNPIALITADLMNGGTLTVGTSGHSVILPVPNATITATRLNSVMPGNSTPRELVAGDIDINSAAFTTNYLNKQGRINNVFLSQTITLGLNMRISSGLPTLVLQAGEFATAALNGPCGTTTTKVQCTYSTVYPYNLISDSYTYRTITPDIIAALNTKGYPLTVTGLFMLANDALGNVDGTIGSEAGASLSSISGAVTTINEGFDGCRVFVGWNVAHCAPTDPNAPILTTASRTTGDMTQTVQTGKLAVSAYPNPFNDVVRFTIQSKVSGNAKLTVYNMMGQQMNVIYNGFVQANKNIQVQYKAPAGAQESLIYILSVNGEKVTGKVLNVNR